MAYERERAWESRRSLEGDRRTLTAPLVARTQQLTDAVVALKTPEQQASAGDYSPPLTFLDVANWLTTYGLCAIGVCLILGFLTPFASICAARLPGHALPVDSPLAGLAAEPQDRGALLDRQQEPRGTDCLPAHRSHGQRPLVRARCPLLRSSPSPSLGAAREQAGCEVWPTVDDKSSSVIRWNRSMSRPDLDSYRFESK